MAGIPSIPPLLCNTPPPIDFGEEDDDSGLPPTLTLEDEDDYGDFALGTDINEDTTNAEVSSLPRTPQFELSSSTTSGFTDIPPAFEDCGTLSITPTEFNNSAASEEVKTQIQLNEAFNYNVTHTFSSANGENNNNTITTDAMRELKQMNDSDTPSTQQNVDDKKPLDFDSNEAKATTTTCTLQDQTVSVTENLAEVTTKQDSQIGDSNAATSEPEIEVKSNFMPIISQSPPPLTDLVLLEDLADDSSDEECHRSPKKSPISTTAPLADNADNNSEDFFAIHIVNTPPSPKEDEFSTIADDINMNSSLNHNNNNTSDLPNTSNANLNDTAEHDDDDFGDFADFETASDFIKPPENSGLVTADSITTAIVDSNQNVEALVVPPADTAIPADDNDDDFDDFQDFSSAPAPTPVVVPIISAPHALSITAENNNTNTQTEPLKTESVEPEVRKKVESETNSFDNDDDDDFGDFEEATFETPASQFTSNAPVSQTPAPATTHANGNIGERLSSVLKMMFPTEEERPATANELQQTVKVANNMNETLPLEAIEAAKALEFQWPQSEMRHALIRSIGIDSRNILFGDKWNPSMPRFAANLSFNPLKPMKPQTTNSVPNTTTYADADAMQYSINSGGSAAVPDISSYAKKTDVPDVEFDWQGAGLVNPLDGAKGETNARETEAVQPATPVARLDTSDDEHQSHTTFASVGDNIAENLSKNDNELTASPTRDVCPSPLALDNAAYQFTAPETAINTISSSTSASSISSNSKPYDNSKTMTTLRLGANIVVDDDDDDDETVVTSTYAGPLKETHIYTPSKADAAITVKASKAAGNGSEPIDFDYEIAAAGIIIDEKVVKKEYRDVEYNPGFSLEVVAEYAGELPTGLPGSLACEPSATAVTVPQAPATQQAAEFDTDEFTEFTEFQSVPPPPPQATVPLADAHFGVPLSATSTITSKFPAELNAKAPLNSQPTVLPAAVAKAKEASKTPSRTNSPSIIDNMILSPAILLPQAIPISTNNGTANTKAAPTIEWGDSTASINPDELARIEELFSQPKMPAVAAAKDVMSASQKTTPIHNYVEKHTKNNSISISASVAMKEQDSTLNDDYWSEFVSVPVTPQLSSNANRNHNNNNNNSINSNNKSNNNNNQLVNTPKRITDVHINNSNNAMRSPRQHQQQQQQQQNSSGQRTLTPTPQQKSAAHASTNISAKSNVYNSNSNSNSNDDDWSDFVSSTPTPAATMTQQQQAAIYMPAAHAPQFNSAAWQNANFYNNPLGLYHQQASMQMRTSPLTPQQQQLQLQQQIHIMQDFSTAPVANRPQNAMSNSNNANINQLQHSNTSYSTPHLQVGSARVAPSISLIPDLGFVAPALPVHTAFVNVLPKTSFNSKK